MAVAELPDWVTGVNIEMQTLAAINVDIIAMTVGTIAVDIVAQTVGNIAVDIAAQTLGTVAVDITAQTLGTVNIDIAAQTLGVVNIDVTSQTVDLDIKTSGGVNIVIDQLTQSAYRERRSTLSNDNGVVAPNAPPNFYTCKTYVGKFFPRGCRGKITEIQIYCKNAGEEQIVLRYSPHPGIGPMGEAYIEALADWSWAIGYVDEMWDYDSLFIWVYTCEAGVDWGYDTATPYDGHEGEYLESWSIALDERPFIRVVYSGETVGDIPVSGIVNTVPIPSISSEALYTVTPGLVLNIPTVLVSVDGAGYIDLIVFNTRLAGSEQTELAVACDGVIAWLFSPIILNTWGFTATTPIISLTNYAVDGPCTVSLTKKFEFRHNLTLYAIDRSVGGSAVDSYVHPTLLK